MNQTTCSAEGCERPVHARGLCSSDYSRHWKAGTLEDAADPRGTPSRRPRDPRKVPTPRLVRSRPCTVEGCDATKHEAHGLCRFHYKRTQPRAPDKPAQGTCDFCGDTYMRAAYGGYKNKIGKGCSELCRYRLVHGWSTKLPDDHWAIMYGQTSKWKPPHMPPPKPERTCQWCGDIYFSYQSQSKYCTKQCITRYHRALRRSRQRQAGGTYTYAQVTQLWIAIGMQCAYCCTPTERQDIQADHVHPLSKRGSNDISNIHPVCVECNRNKTDTLIEDWNTVRARGGYPPLWLGWVKDRHLTMTVQGIDLTPRHLLPNP